MPKIQIELLFDQAIVATPTRTISQTPAGAAASTGDSVTQPGEWYDPDRRPDEFSKTIRDYMIHEGIELDPISYSRSRDHSKKYRIIGKKRVTPRVSRYSNHHSNRSYCF